MNYGNNYIDFVAEILSLEGLEGMDAREIVNESMRIDKLAILWSLLEVLSKNQVKNILEDALYITADGLAELYPSCGDTESLEALFQGRYDVNSYYSKPRGEENNTCYYKFSSCRKIMDRSFADLSTPLNEG